MHPGTVVSGQAWRRWVIVVAVVAVLCSVPIVINVWPARAASADASTLRAAMAASAGKPYQGYAQSSGLLPLPSIPNLDDVVKPLSGRTEMRVWHAARDRWRVDVLDGATERDVYQTPTGQMIWDFGANQLVQVVGEQPVRLPRPADYTPPELVRRLLAIAAGDRVESLAGKRVAGVNAAGLRLIPASADTTVDHVDVWADPATGLPVQAEVTARGGERPVFVTRFLELHQTTPDTAHVTPPVPGEGVGFTVAPAPDFLSRINQRRRGVLPSSVGGLARGSEVEGVTAAAVYGTGLAQIVVIALPGRFGGQAYDRIATYGQDVDVPQGRAAVLGTGLLTLMTVQGDRTYLVAGFVQPAVLRRVAADLARSA
jgi:hypothetical protein